MNETKQTPLWQPVAYMEREASLDAIRGVALFGVLLVNLLGDFRVSLSEHILSFHTHPGWANRTVDVLAAAVIEFKAFTLFSLLFGVGIAVFAERAAKRGMEATYFLARRFVVLLALGLCHLLLVWNGDILTLYAVCGLLFLPFRRLPAAGLAIAGLAAVALGYLLPGGFLWPGETTLTSLAKEAAQVYTEGRFSAVLAFHLRETRLLVLPLLVSALPRTWGLMALGAAAWQFGVFRNPQQHRYVLGTVALVGGVVGGAATFLSVSADSSGQSSWVPRVLLDVSSSLPLALAYAAVLLLVLRLPRAKVIARPIAAAGQMALTNYLAQSVILSLLFYGYGVGLYGRLGPALASAIGVAFYAGQMAFSLVWLRRYRFGPVEWLWRSLTYVRWQPLSRAEVTEAENLGRQMIQT